MEECHQASILYVLAFGFCIVLCNISFASLFYDQNYLPPHHARKSIVQPSACAGQLRCGTVQRVCHGAMPCRSCSAVKSARRKVICFGDFGFRKLIGSSAQISSGVCRSGSQEQVPEEGSGRFRRVPVCAGVGSGGRFRKVLKGSGRGFRKVPESSWCRFLQSSGVCWCTFWRQVPEGSERVCAGGKFRKVLESSGECWCIGSGGRFRKVPESSAVCWCSFRRVAQG